MFMNSNLRRGKRLLARFAYMRDYVFFQGGTGKPHKKCGFGGGEKKNVFHHLVHHPSVFFKHVFLLIDHERSSGIDVLFSQSAAPSDSAAVEGPGPSVKQ